MCVKWKICIHLDQWKTFISRHSVLTIPFSLTSATFSSEVKWDLCDTLCPGKSQGKKHNISHRKKFLPKLQVKQKLQTVRKRWFRKLNYQSENTTINCSTLVIRICQGSGVRMSIIMTPSQIYLPPNLQNLWICYITCNGELGYWLNEGC